MKYDDDKLIKVKIPFLKNSPGTKIHTNDDMSL